MPTGYTAFIEDGKIDNAKDFLKLCLRAFGVTAMWREDPLDTVIDFDEKYSHEIKFYTKRIQERKDALHVFENKTDEELRKDYYCWISQSIVRCKKDIEYNQQLSDKYEEIFSDIKRWDCPEKMKNIKEFAIDQIEKSKKYVDVDYYRKELQTLYDKVSENSFNEWKKSEIHKIQDDISYYEEEKHKYERMRDEGKNQYNEFLSEIEKI